MAYDPDVEELKKPLMKKLLRIEPYVPSENQRHIIVGVHGRDLMPVYRLKKHFCSRCSNEATKKAIYDVGGAELIEKYCNECVVKMVS